MCSWVLIARKKKPGSGLGKIPEKISRALADKEPIIVKADLVDKGIYYRLRVGGFASAAEAKTFCGKLAAAGQACILPTDK